MKRFEFSLQRILDYRQSLLEREKNNLMALFAQRNVLEDKIENLKHQYGVLGEELRATAEAGTTVLELRQITMKLEATKRSTDNCILELAELDGRIEQQRETVKELSQDVSGLEKLRDKQREEYDYESRKEEEERIAELISSKIARGED